VGLCTEFTLGIEGKAPLKAAAKTTVFGGEFSDNRQLHPAMVNDADETTPLLVPLGSDFPNDVTATQEPGTKAVSEVEEDAVSADPEAGSVEQADITFTSPIVIVSVLSIGKILKLFLEGSFLGD